MSKAEKEARLAAWVAKNQEEARALADQVLLGLAPPQVGNAPGARCVCVGGGGWGAGTGGLHCQSGTICMFIVSLSPWHL